MTPRARMLIVVLTGFSALTGVALSQAGYLGILLPHFRSWGAGQVLADLAILAVLSCLWMVRDARRQGRRAWPYVALTLVAGSFGPLTYLLVGEWGESRSKEA